MVSASTFVVVAGFVAVAAAAGVAAAGVVGFVVVVVVGLVVGAVAATSVPGTFTVCPTFNAPIPGLAFLMSSTLTLYFFAIEYKVSPETTLWSIVSLLTGAGVVAVVVAGFVAAAVLPAFTGKFNVCPTLIEELNPGFAFFNASTEIPYLAAMLYNVSPAATVCVLAVPAAVAVAAGGAAGPAAAAQKARGHREGPAP